MIEKGISDNFSSEGTEVTNIKYSDRLKTDSEFLGAELLKYRPIITRFCYSIVGSRYGNDLADEIAQDTMHNAVRSIATYKEAASFKNWLMTIANNACMDKLRSFSTPRYGDRDPRKQSGFDDPAIFTSLVDPSQNPEQSFLIQERKAALLEFASTLDPRDRNIFMYKFLDEQTSKEVADLIGGKEGTIKGRIREIKLKLKRFLRKSPKGKI